MTQEQDKLIDLSVHESAVPSVIDPNRDKKLDVDKNDDLNDSVHDHENVDVPTPDPLDTDNDNTVADRQIISANLGAG
ncbi:hypothetical protein I8748_17415 [Nostoc sp. CENA67]|uniref:Uncharacterized protein n=1 Tax=Amazonocrinis nigriterrae CENA67 TaxID=2794033 RepID=A0A8J7LAD5_9NOST|nr:hypothetical protein [Amazonocrinis nigriterrae]MBH8563941.1 hypothetical protein [Amazonocrinis nigriterrae CENA67]